MNPAEAVAAFNALPRNPITPSGLAPNHWHFSLRLVTISPIGLLVFIINPAARYIHTEGPIDISLRLATSHEQGTVVAWALLKAFQKSELGQVRPWSWSTNDAGLAAAVGNVFRQWGVSDGLDQIRAGNAEESAISNENWNTLMDHLVRGITGGRS